MSARTNPWLERRVLAYAHQGGAREGPSSTLYAIEKALASGADAIELDVHATLDGELVVCHDPTIDRTTNGSGRISAMTLAELRDLDSAHWFVEGEGACRGRDDAAYGLRGRAPGDGALGVATLESVLDAFPKVPLNLDVKQTAPAVPAYEELLVTMLRRFGRADDVIVAAFDHRSTDVVATLAPEIGLSAGSRQIAAFLLAARTRRRAPVGLRRYVALQVPPRAYGMALVTKRLVRLAHEVDLAVHVWTIDDPLEMARLVDLGVDGIMSDVPSVLAGVLAQKGAAWTGSGKEPG